MCIYIYKYILKRYRRVQVYTLGNCLGNLDNCLGSPNFTLMFQSEINKKLKNLKFIDIQNVLVIKNLFVPPYYVPQLCL